MGKQPEDAYPDPRKACSGRCKTRALICICLLLLYLGSFITVVSAGDNLPDPRSILLPVYNECPDSKLPIKMPIMRNPTIFMVK